MLRSRAPVPNATVVTVDADSGEALDAWGENQFYMPHGIAIDAAGNTYLTDAGSHQVLRVNALVNIKKPNATDAIWTICSFHPVLIVPIWSWARSSFPAATRRTFASRRRWWWPTTRPYSSSPTGTATPGSWSTPQTESSLKSSVSRPLKTKLPHHKILPPYPIPGTHSWFCHEGC